MGIRLRLAASLVLALGALGYVPPLASATGYVGIAPPGSSFGSELSLAALPGAPPPDVADRDYGNVVTGDGAPGTVHVTGGYLLSTLLQAAQFPPTSYTVAEIRLLTGRSLLLTTDQVTAGSGFPDGPPVVSEVGGQAQVLVPSSGAGPGQTVVAPTVSVKLHTGALLAVEASASALQVKVGETVSFRSLATGAVPGESLSYRWNFDDGSGAATAEASHVFPVPGTYDVYVSVTGGQDSIGLSAVLPVIVGKAPKGPNRKGGGTNKDATAPSSGAGTRGTGGKKGSGSGKSGGGTSGGDGGGEGAGGEADTTGTQQAAAGGSAAAPSSSPSPPDTTTRRAAPATTRPRPSRRPRRPSSTGTRSGWLLTGAQSSARPAPARDARPAAGRAGVATPARTGQLRADSGLSDRDWMIAGLLAALSAGTLLETTGRHRRPSRVARRAPTAPGSGSAAG